jgi:hypothetical protein
MFQIAPYTSEAIKLLTKVLHIYRSAGRTR